MKQIDPIERTSALIFENQEIRVITQNGKPYFVAKDVCNVLEISDHKVALRKLADKDKGEYSILSLNSGGIQKTKIITEGGFYKLILRSKKACIEGTQAHRFSNWVCDEVLPTIRKTGGYGIPFAELNDFTHRERNSIERGHDAGVNLNVRKIEKHALAQEKAFLIVKYQPSLF